MTDTSKVLPVGTVLRSGSCSYTIAEVLGQGGFGITYRATAKVSIGNIKIDAQFAIKEHFVDRYCERDDATYAVSYSRPVAQEVENSRKDFLSEARRLRDLSKDDKRHPNIVCVNETFEANNTAYFVMEYLKGESLSAYVKRRGPLSDNEMRAIMKPIIDAVAFLHREYITHLDIKPANIMLTRDDNDRLRPVLIDFGLSRHFDPTTGEPSSTIQQAGFSEGYAPVEQVEAFSHFYPGTDVYSLGATMLFAVTGRTPVSATDLDDETLRHCIPAGLPASTVAAITAAMHHFRKHRPENAGALLSVLTGGDSNRRYDNDPIIPEIYEPTQKTIMPPKPRQTPTPTPKRVQNPYPRREPRQIPTPTPTPQSKSRKGLYVGIVVVVLLVLGCVAWFTNGFGLLDKQVGLAPKFAETTAGLDMKMILVEGGEFKMGGTSEQGTDARRDEYPVHSVSLDSYYISETEVTQAQWEKVMGTTIQQQAKKAAEDVPKGVDMPIVGVGPDYPMYYVNWYDAQKFCEELSRMTGRKYCLPTEAEWEYAARGGKYASGTKYSGSNSVGDVAWYDDNSSERTHPVKGKNPNSLGLYDMSGNVWEWCLDGYVDYNANAANNPGRMEKTVFIDAVVRGGSWSLDARRCRVSNRGFGSPGYPLNNCGFRVVMLP